MDLISPGKYNSVYLYYPARWAHDNIVCFVLCPIMSPKSSRTRAIPMWTAISVSSLLITLMELASFTVISVPVWCRGHTVRG